MLGDEWVAERSGSGSEAGVTAHTRLRPVRPNAESGRRRLLGRGAVAAIVAAFAALLLSNSAAQAVRAPPLVYGDVGHSVTLDNEQTDTVVQVQRWYGGRNYVPPAGKAIITVLFRVKGLRTTSFNPLYFDLEESDGTSHNEISVGGREPMLRSSNDLQAGQVAQGWLTFLAPLTKMSDMHLVYRMHGGSGSSLIVMLGGVPDSPRSAVAVPAVLQGEQAITVTRVERPASIAQHANRAGYQYVTVYVRIHALRATTTGSFTAFTSAGDFYDSYGYRAPAFPEGRALAQGQTIQGWVTLHVPQKQSHGLTFVYNLARSRDNLLVPLPG